MPIYYAEGNPQTPANDRCETCGDKVPPRADGSAPALCGACFARVLREAVRGTGYQVVTF